MEPFSLQKGDFLERAKRAMNFVTSPGTYTAFGQTAVKSKGIFRISRNGNFITADGEVVHGFDNDHPDRTYDFNPGQPGHAPGAILENVGKAKPFNFDYRHRERNRTVIRIHPDGSRTIESSRWWKAE